MPFSFVSSVLLAALFSLISRASMATKDPESVYDISIEDANGNSLELSQYKDKVLLIVNVASKCGMTNSNYTELNELYNKYKDKGLEILAFPCNQFGEEEPGTTAQITEFVCTRFKSEFPIFNKVRPGIGYNLQMGNLRDEIQWNFAKFLVDKNGQAVERYYPTTSPLTLEHDIKKLLNLS
ncbi:putative glutathione peroxidase 8 [Raphanus sativus]|nr:putative glutathione peroxidase 8 [Raphanus sativus]